MTKMLPKNEKALRQELFELQCALDAERRRQEESEQRLRLLEDNLPSGMLYQVIVNPDGSRRFTFLSAGVAQAHGVTPEQVYSDSMTLFRQIQEEDRPLLIDAEAAANRAGTPFNVELRFRPPNGDLHCALLRATPHRTMDGCLVWDGLEIDITERRKAEEALRESEEKYRQLVEASPDAMFLRDKDGMVSYINPEGLRILGATHPEQVIGRLSLEFVHPQSHAAVAERAKRVIEEGETVPLLEEKFIRLDGSVVEVEVTAAPFSQEGKPGMQVIFHDITKRKQAEDAFQRQTEEIRWLMKSMANAFVVWGMIFDEAGLLADIRFDYFNDAFEKVSRLKLADVQGKTIRKVWPATEQSWFDVYGEVALTGKTKSFEMYHGPTRGLYDCTAYRPFNNPERICCVFENITDRKHAEEARRESEQFLQQVIDNAPFGAHFYRMEDDDRLILSKTNKAADQILKIDHDLLLGKPVEAAFPGLAGTEIPSIYKEIARNGTEYTEERVYSDESGISGTYEINAF
jgi:PAS domain S-box-containing protein